MSVDIIMAIWKSYRIADIVREIQDKRFVIPSFQRPFVWGEDKIKLLFDTVLKGDSFGGIMVVEEEKGAKPLFLYKPFSNSHSTGELYDFDKLNQQQYLVIDGQQRLTSFYVGLTGHLYNKTLHFDLFSDYRGNYEFCFFKTVTDNHENADSFRILNRSFWISVPGLFQRLVETNDEDLVADEIIDHYSIENSNEISHIFKNVKAFYKNIITAESLGVSKVIINNQIGDSANKQRIIELHRRLNVSGVQMSGADFRATIIKSRASEKERENEIRENLISYEERHNDKLI